MNNMECSSEQQGILFTPLFKEGGCMTDMYKNTGVIVALSAIMLSLLLIIFEHYQRAPYRETMRHLGKSPTSEDLRVEPGPLQ
jgi:hypothetical protein